MNTAHMSPYAKSELREPDPQRGEHSRSCAQRQGKSFRGYIAASLSLIAVFAASGAPYPLYERYRIEEGLSTGDLSWATVSYLFAVLATLLVFGQISDYLGRKPVTLAALVLAALGSAVLLHLNGMMVLILGRVLQGAACGLAASATQAYVLDTAPRHPTWLGAATATNVSQIGIVLGTLGGGFLAWSSPSPEQAPMLASIMLTVLALLLVIAADHDPVGRRSGAMTSLRPVVAIPQAARPLIVASAGVFISTWALTGFYQSFAPTISATYLGTRNPVMAALVIASVVGPQPFGAAVSGRIPVRKAQVYGSVTFAFAVSAIAFGLYRHSAPLVIGSGLIAGLSQGVGYTASVRMLLDKVTGDQHAGLMSAISMISYIGSAVPSFIAGQLSLVMFLQTIATGYVGLAAAGALLIIGIRHRTT
ncbi:MAG: MFS transporter [Bifidobacterium crudilactis]|uniref:MFS transporter n=2 Tax=Bifidobacterium crudilactis TaxID=327277 RepID=A0A971CYK3_9BIFI|nr:MFS transporter [Bifidobacterium crudilactis]